MKPKILFILKHRENAYGGEPDPYSKTMSSGLLNSASYICQALNQGYDTNLVEAIDNNDIDREVTRFRPDIVVIEAYWVVPEKFEVLTKFHPSVKWIIRNHSNAPFLANEGMAYGWTTEYVKYPNVWVSSNHPAAQQEFMDLLRVIYDVKGGEQYQKAVFTPNYYPVPDTIPQYRPYAGRGTIDVGCFGAIRPLKNQMIQALAAIEWSRQNGKYLRFHMNGGRIEDNGDPIAKNLRTLFSGIQTATLVEHPWLSKDDFLKLVATMDLGLQVSFSETFNIVAADFVTRGVSIVVSSEIGWVDHRFHAKPTSVESICDAMTRALSRHAWVAKDQTVRLLQSHNAETLAAWDLAIGTVLG
jgi:hypothetical protein